VSLAAFMLPRYSPPMPFDGYRMQDRSPVGETLGWVGAGYPGCGAM
jgi:hypothetical protein